MRITFVISVVVVAVICLAQAPCVPARPLQLLSLGADSDLVIITTREQLDEVSVPPLLQAFELGVVQRRSLKSSSRKKKGSKSTAKKKATKTKAKKSKKWKGGKGAAFGSVTGVAVFLGVLFLLLVVYIVLTERREGDPKWSVRSFFRRRLKPKYRRSKKTGKGEDIDDVEKKVLPAEVDTGPVKKVVEPADVK